MYISLKEIIKEAFIDSYQLLTSNVKFKMADFMNLMRNSSNNANTAKELESLNKRHKELVAKKDKLLDFLIEDKITQDVYDEKMEKFKHKLEIIEHRQEQLKLIAEDKNGIEEGLKKIQNILETNNILNEFDQEVFDALVDHIVVGYVGEGKAVEVLKNDKSILSGVLADELVNAIDGYSKEWDINGENITLSVKKI